LATGAENVATPAFADIHVEACLSHNGLKGCNVAFGWTAKRTSGKFIEWNQIDFARDPADKLGEPARIIGVIVHPRKQHVLEGESSSRR
jgi:hypothetical protein